MRPLKLVLDHTTAKGAQTTFRRLSNALSSWHAYLDGDVWIRRSIFGKKVLVYFMPEIELGELFERLYRGRFCK